MIAAVVVAQDTVGLIGEGFVAVGVLAGIVYIYRRLPGWWNAHMKARHARFVAEQGESVREIELRKKLQTIIKKGLLAAVDAQEISQKEETKIIGWVKVQLGMPDLYPGRSNKEVKEKLKAEKSAEFSKGVHGFKAGNKA